jgi:hypothetical protein
MSGGSLKLREHLNRLLSGRRDTVGVTHTMGYIELQFLTK